MTIIKIRRGSDEITLQEEECAQIHWKVEFENRVREIEQYAISEAYYYTDKEEPVTSLSDFKDEDFHWNSLSAAEVERSHKIYRALISLTEDDLRKIADDYFENFDRTKGEAEQSTAAIDRYIWAKGI